MVDTVQIMTFFVFEIPKAKIILETSFYKLFLFLTSSIHSVFRSTCVYINVKSDINSDGCCT